jgi:SAM-dependent methyltransferase
MFHPDGPTFRELMHQALSSTERGYDLLATKFERTPFRTPDEILAPLVARIGEARSIDSALDVCCGTGAALRAILPLCRTRVVGIDFSEGMLAEARRRLDENQGGASAEGVRVDLVRGDVLAMTFDGEFDVVTCVGAFGHILPTDEDRFVARIARALRPGGRFIFATSEHPAVTSRGYWIARSFNAVMRARNAVVRPPFIMYYLTFMWPDVRVILERHGLVVHAEHNVFPAPFERGVLVTARRAA